MQVFKFGGASVKNANGVKNLAKIVASQNTEKLLIVISAMDKTTNALEKLTQLYFNQEDYQTTYNEIKKFHFDILHELINDKKHESFDLLNNAFVELEWILEDKPHREYDFFYDQIVSLGEIFSTIIVSGYLNYKEIKNKWLDAKDIIKTDDYYREATVNFELSANYCNSTLTPLFQQENIIITQGFIGVNDENYATTLGREGSDYSASIFAYLLEAKNVTIWKDVDGVLNADPKHFNNTQILKNISYKEAIELTYFGASVIHPKTLKPLQNKNIPLLVKSFVNPTNAGTTINNNTSEDSKIPSYIFKQNQVLISISARDYSFVNERNLKDIFNTISSQKVKVNLMQMSALSFSICIDNNEKTDELIQKLSTDFKVLFNNDCQLLTIRHFDENTIQNLIANKEILVEQRTRNTARFVIN